MKSLIEQIKTYPGKLIAAPTALVIFMLVAVRLLLPSYSIAHVVFIAVGTGVSLAVWRYRQLRGTA